MENYLERVVPRFVELCGETGAAVTLCDEFGNVIAHCGGGADACRHMRQNEKLRKRCRICDENARKRLAAGCDLFEYVCHAGLSEVAAAIRGKNGDLDGYIIMGKYLTGKAVEETKSAYRTLLSRTDLDLSALPSAFRTLPGLRSGQLKKALLLLEETAKSFEAEGILKGFRDPDVLQIMQLAGTSKREKITCKKLYNLLGISRHPLENIIERCCGEKLSAFLKQRTLIRAEDLLMNTRLGVDKIAETLGYDLPGFTDFFRRLYGDTPGNFRKFGVDRKVRLESALAARTRHRIPI